MPDTATSLDSHAGLMFHSADFISSRTHSQNDSEGTDNIKYVNSCRNDIL